MNISIFGLGYVGCVSIACLAENGHSVVGVDVIKSKVDLINSGKPTIVEKDIDDLMKKNHSQGRISATNSSFEAVINSDVSMICVGTPLGHDGNLDLRHVYSVINDICKALKDKNSFHVIAIRSTVLPGTNESIVKIIENETGKKSGLDFGVISNPEFLREGTAVQDYFNPPVTVLGTNCIKSYEIMKKVYSKVDETIIQVNVKEAEIIKYVNNSFHALKISFANEIGNICKKLNINSFNVMNLFCSDNQLNISSKYFRPGFAYGGSCLPKDLSALCQLAKTNDTEVSILNAISKTNELQKKKTINMISNFRKNRIGILGLSFKKGTDDLRCSPIVDVAREIIAKGADVRIYDHNVNYTNLNGINKEFIDSSIPDLSSLLVLSFEEIISHSEIIIINHDYNDVTDKVIVDNPNITFIDLVNINSEYHDNYEGISW